MEICFLLWLKRLKSVTDNGMNGLKLKSKKGNTAGETQPDYFHL